MPAFDQLSLSANGNTGAGAARHIGFSVAALMLAGTALAPAFAQTADLGGLTVSRNDFVNFNPPGIGIEPTEITNGLLRINPLASLTYAGDLTDSGGVFSLLKFGANDLTLAGVNTHSGQTTVQGGRLIAGSATALSANSLLAIAGPVAGLATADLNGFSQTVNGLVGNGTGVLTSTTGPAILTIDTTTNLTFNGALQGDIGITKRGTSVQTFTNLNPGAAATNATGPIRLEAGALRIGSSNALGSGALTVAGVGTLSVAGVTPLTFDNAIDLQAGLTVAAAANQSIALNGTITAASSLTKLGVGEVIITGVNGYTGGTTLSGGRLVIGNASALGTGTVTQTQTSSIALVNPAADLTLANAFQLDASSLQIETPNAGVVFTLSGNISGGPDVNLIAGNGGTVVLTGNNSFPGMVRLRSGTLGIANASGVNSASAIRAEAANRDIVILAADQLVTTRLASNVGDGALAITVNTGANNVEFSNSLRDGFAGAGDTLAIVKTGVGIFTASNASNTALGRTEVTGGFSVAEGTLNLTGRMANDINVASGATLAGTGFQDVGTTTISDGATLSAGDARNAAPSIGTLALNNLTLGATASTVFDLGLPSIDTFAPINDLIVVAGNLDLGGSTLNFNILPGFTTGTYRLMTYAGALSGTANLGLLPVGFIYTLNTAGGNVDLGVELIDFYWDGNGPANNIVVEGGPGTWNVANTNWTDVGGNISIAWQNNARAFFTNVGGDVTVDGNFTYSTLFFTVDGYALNPAAGATLGADAGTIDVAAAAEAMINVDLVGTNGLTKAGDGTLVLSGTNSFTGGLFINAGTVAVTQAAALGADAVTINGGTQTLRFDADMTVTNNINGVGFGYNVDTGANTVTLEGSLSGGGADKLGSGTLVLNNAVNAQPNLLGVIEGSLIVNGGVQGSVTVASGALVGGIGSITETATVDGTLSAGTNPGLAGTLTVGDLVLGNSSTTLFDLGVVNVVGGTNDLVVVDNNLALDGTLIVNPLAGWHIGTGSFRLFNYAGALTDNGLDLGGALLTPPADVTYTVNTTVANQVTLDIGYTGEFNWDGTGAPVDGIIQGGSGVWNAGNTNWTNSDGLFNLAWVDSTATVANFGGVSGGGQVTVEGTRTFGTLNFTTTGYTLGGAGDLAMNGGIVNVTAEQATINVAINGAGGLTKNGAGELVLGTANGYTDGTTVNAGVLTMAANGATGTGTVTLADGTTLRSTVDITHANAVNMLGLGTFDILGNEFTQNGLVSGGLLLKSGAGRLTLANGANDYAGGTDITNGTVAVATDGALGTGNIRFSGLGGTLETLGSFTTAKSVTLDAAGVINTNANTNRFDGLVSGPSTLTKIGSGTLILTNTNSYAGGTFLTEGTIQISNGSAMGSGTLTAAGGTTLIAGLAINTPPITLAQDIVLTGGNLTINLLGSNYGVNVTTGALLTNGTALTLNGTISGAGGIDTLGFLANGGGSIAFNSTNSYEGGTNLGSVIAYIGADGALGTGAVNLNAFGAGIQNTGAGTSFTLGNAINVNDTQHGLGGAGNLVLSGAIGGNGELFKVNSGTVTFTGVGSSFGGAFAVNGGTVEINGSFDNAAATMVVAGGSTLSGNGSFAGSVTLDNGGVLSAGANGGVGVLTLGNLSLSGLSNLNFQLGAANTLGGPLNDRVIVGGNLVLDGLLNVTETAGGAFTLGIYNLFSYGTLTNNGLAVNGGLPGGLTGTVQINGAAQQVNLVVAGPDSIVMNWDGTDFTAAVPGGQGGDGVWNATNTNWTGEAPGEINATWQNNAVGIFGGTGGSVDVASAFTFAGLGFQADGYVLNDAGGSLNTNSTLGSFISVDGGLTATINATVGGTGQLFKQGAGTLVLGGTNTLTGNVNLANGTLAVTSDTALGLGALIATGGTTLASGTAPSQGTITLANSVVLNGLLNVDLKGTTGDIAPDGTLTADGNNLVLNGTVSGAGGLSVGGFGALVLNGANTYTGGTLATFAAIYVGTDSALGAGALTLNNGVLGNASGSTRTLANNIILAGDGTVLGPNDLVLNGTISGAGALTKQTTSTLTLNGANSYADGTDLFGGTIVVGTNSALGTGQLRVEDAGQATTLRAGIDGLNVGNAVVLGTNANLIVDSQAFNFTLSGVVGGPGALTKVGSGNLSLTNANGYSGGTLLNAGSISVFTNTSLGGGSLIMQDGTSLIAGANALSLANAAVLNGNSTVNTNGFQLTLSGIISGSGTLVKAGMGPLILSGTNSYSGGTSLNTGAIVIANNSALGTGTVTMADSTALVSALANTVIGNNIVTLGNGTLNTLANNFTINGIISGAGSITKVGTGNLFLNGANSYAGGTALNAGTITVGNNAGLGTGTLTMVDGTFLVAGVDGLNVGNAVVTLGNGTIDTGANVFTLSGILSGAGSFTKLGSGNLILTGANTYAGGTLLNAGTITVANNSALGTGTLTMADGTTLASGAADLVLANAITTLGVGTIDTAGNTLTLNGVIDGAGSLTKVNTGNLVLNGVNLYSGGTSINGGTVTVGTNTALGTGDVVMADGTMLRAGVDGLALANLITINGTSTMNTQGFTFTLNGVIGGTGTLAKIGTGTLVLNGANSYAGGTALNAGTIRVGNNSALGTGTLTMADGTTLASGAADLVLANAITTLGAGTVDTTANVFTLNGVIDGAGSISKVGSGTLVLGGDNAYSGGTNLNAGTIQVNTNTALGTGGLVMADGTALLAGVNSLALANGVTLNGTSTLNTQGFTLTLNGVIGGTGTLSKIGTGTLELNGDNTYSGGTSLTAGTIRVGNNNALGTGNLAMAAGTILQSGAAALTIGNTISMAGGATVDVAGQTLTLGGLISGAGPLSVIDSASVPAAALVLTGLNTYTGGTVVTGTTVLVSQDANLGNAAGGITLVGGTLRTTASFSTARTFALGTGGGTVDVATGTTLTTTGVVSGTSLTKIGGGTLALNAANTYAGGTALNAGTISVGNNAALGTGALAMAGGTTLAAGANNLALANAISTAGVGTVDTGSNIFTLAGVVSGAGSIAKVGTGNLVVNGANTYAGGTALNAGTITVGNNAGLGTGVLTMADATTLSAGVTGLTVANNIVTLGAATINSGATPSALTLSGVISGAGSVSKTGTGILNLTGASTYTGATTVAAGTLNVTGSLASTVTVNAGAALTGTGTVGPLNVVAGGSVNPGVPGATNTATLAVAGSATLNGTYTANIAATTSDLIAANGTLTKGGTLVVVPLVPTAFTQFNRVYTVASGTSRTGTFATTLGMDQFGAAFNPVVEYTATQVNIRLAPQSLVTLGNRFGGISGNALEVAQAFDRAVAGGYNPQAFFALYNAGSNLPRTLRELSGEQRATERRVVLDSNRVTRETAFDRLNLGMASMAGQQVSTSDGDSSLTFWLRGAGTWGKAQTSGAATSFQTEQLGLLTGIDWSRDTLTVGGMFHYTTTNVEFGVLGGSSRVESVGGTVYAGWRQQDSGFVINAGVSLAGARTNGSRAITLAGFTQSLAGSTTGTTYQVFGELAFDLAKGTNTRIEPFVRNAYIGADIKALTETGGIAALTAPRASYNINVTNAGMRFGTALNGKIDVNASAAWQRTSGAREAATQIGIPAVGQNGNIRSVSIDKDALLLQAGLGANLSDKIRIGVDYSGLIGARNDDHGGRATLNFAF